MQISYVVFLRVFQVIDDAESMVCKVDASENEKDELESLHYKK